MQKQLIIDEIGDVALAMFRKNFFGVYHGSISAKIEQNRFIINKKTAIFSKLDKNNLTEIHSEKDYSWNDASIDANIHVNIYNNISEAKYVCYAMPPFTVAYTLNHNSIIPKDYFASEILGKIDIYDPKQFDDWYERAEVEIYRYFIDENINIMVIKGYGIYIYDRDIHSMAKKIALVENACKILLLAKSDK